MADNNNILHNNDEPIEELLMKYLQGNLTEEERFKVESTMADSSFVNDAMEGLQDLKDNQKIRQSVDELNRQLQTHLDKKKRRKISRKLPSMDWIIVYVIIVILICLLGYSVIHLHYNPKKTITTKSISNP
jgi:hypothetical protein